MMARRARSGSASQPGVPPILRPATLSCAMDDTDCEDHERKREQLVPLTGRRRTPDRVHDSRAEVLTGLVDAAGLTPAERAALFGGPPVDETMQRGDVMAAATGLVKLAAQHVARRLAAPAAPTLTAQDRMAMALVPSLVVELRQNVRTRPATEGARLSAHDPILELLVKAENHPGSEVADE